MPHRETPEIVQQFALTHAVIIRGPARWWPHPLPQHLCGAGLETPCRLAPVLHDPGAPTALRTEQLRHETPTHLDAVLLRMFGPVPHDLGRKLRVGRKGDVLLLDGGYRPPLPSPAHGPADRWSPPRSSRPPPRRHAGENAPACWPCTALPTAAREKLGRIQSDQPRHAHSSGIVDGKASFIDILIVRNTMDRSPQSE
jgi:hypothetical protein